MCKKLTNEKTAKKMKIEIPKEFNKSPQTSKIKPVKMLRNSKNRIKV